MTGDMAATVSERGPGRAAAPQKRVAARIFERALLARLVEERLLQLFSEGKLSGTLHTCIGQELTGAILSEFLQPGDTVFSSHRGHGHFLCRTDDPAGLISELMGKSSGVCGGLGGSQHLCKEGFYTNGIQGGIVPVATGLALAAKLGGSKAISVVVIGDGTLGEGVIYETFNIAAKWELPLLVVLEDNGIAQSTSHSQTFAGSVESRANGFGLQYASGNTWDWPELYHVTARVVTDLRQCGRPALLHVRTFRLRPHSKGDDTRSRAEIEPFERKDPVNRFIAEPENAGIVNRVRERVEQAVLSSEQAPPAVYSAPWSGGKEELRWSSFELSAQKLVVALNQCLRECLARDEKVLLIGEDLESPYGGAFKVTQNLSAEFPGRIRNTPISEAGIVGVGGGLALAGWKPIVEIMFGDFVGLAFDQLVNHAAKFERMYNGQVRMNLVVRTPMGGRRGYGPTHSQTLDRHFLGAPGLRVLALHNLLAPHALYGPLLSGDSGATLVLENKTLYGLPLRARAASGFDRLVSNERFPTFWLKPNAAAIDLTLLGYGGMAEMLVNAAERLFEEHDLIAQVLCPLQIYPFDLTPLRSILANADALLVAEEGQAFAGFGAEVLAQMAESASAKPRRISRMGPPQDIIPSSSSMERAMLPSLEGIIDAAKRLCG